MIRAVVRSPFTEPSFLISIRSFARRLPFTVPYTTTSRAIMSAVTLAVAPTVSLRSSSWINPSTEPSIKRSSLPVISPFTCRLDPSRAVARSPVAPSGRMASVLIAVVPSQVAGADFGNELVAKFFGSGCATCCVSGFLTFPHMKPPKGQSTPSNSCGVITDFRPVRRTLQTAYQRGVRESNYPEGQFCYWTEGNGPAESALGACLPQADEARNLLTAVSLGPA